jgi:hypothetical protein
MKKNSAADRMLTAAVKDPAAVAAALAALCNDLLPVWVRHLQVSREQSEIAVKQMLQAFSGIESHMRKAFASTDTLDAKVQHDVESMYEALQYQDRIGQMLALLQDDVERLLKCVQSPATVEQDFKSAEWMQHLESHYAMAEQRRDHSAESGDQGVTNTGTSFF